MFFLTGTARSGTTLLSCLLNLHPQLGVASDTGFFGAQSAA